MPPLKEPTLKRRTFLSIAAGVGAAGVGAVTVPRLWRSSTPSYTFADEFDGAAGSAPDPSKWTYDLGGGGWGNNELEIYTDSRANSLLDGHTSRAACRPPACRRGRSAGVQQDAAGCSKAPSTYEVEGALSASPRRAHQETWIPGAACHPASDGHPHEPPVSR